MFDFKGMFVIVIAHNVDTFMIFVCTNENQRCDNPQMRTQSVSYEV